MKALHLFRLLTAATVAAWLLPSSTLALEIIAHRGASFDAPENTISAAKLGWRQGADGVEIDVHLTKDNKIVVIHDADTKRVSGAVLKIAEHTFDELRALDVGSWKSSAYKGEKIPSLDEILETIPNGKKLFVEIKCGPEVLPVLEASLKKAGRLETGIVIISFSHPVVQQAKIRFPQIPVYWLSNFKKDKTSGTWSPTVEELIKKAKEAKVDGLDLNAQTAVLNADSVAKIRAAGLQFHVWTVDDVELARTMKSLDVDSITTNRPEWLRQQLSR